MEEEDGRDTPHRRYSQYDFRAFLIVNHVARRRKLSRYQFSFSLLSGLKSVTLCHAALVKIVLFKLIRNLLIHSLHSIDSDGLIWLTLRFLLLK